MISWHSFASTSRLSSPSVPQVSWDTFQHMAYERIKFKFNYKRQREQTIKIPRRWKSHPWNSVCVCVKKLPSQTKRLASTYFLMLQNNFICTFFLQCQSHFFSLTCSNSSAQRCAVGQSQLAVPKGIMFSRKAFLRKGHVIRWPLSIGFLVQV